MSERMRDLRVPLVVAIVVVAAMFAAFTVTQSNAATADAAVGHAQPDDPVRSRAGARQGRLPGEGRAWRRTRPGPASRARRPPRRRSRPRRRPPTARTCSRAKCAPADPGGALVLTDERVLAGGRVHPAARAHLGRPAAGGRRPGAGAPGARRGHAGAPRWTYAQLLDEAERAARALLARFEPGERVAVVGQQPAGVGDPAARRGPGRHHRRDRQPGAARARAGARARQVARSPACSWSRPTAGPTWRGCSRASSSRTCARSSPSPSGTRSWPAPPTPTLPVVDPRRPRADPLHQRHHRHAQGRRPAPPRRGQQRPPLLRAHGRP